MKSEYDTFASHTLMADLQQRVLRMEAALKGLDNNDIRAFNRLGGLEDRIAELEAKQESATMTKGTSKGSKPGKSQPAPKPMPPMGPKGGKGGKGGKC